MRHLGPALLMSLVIVAGCAPRNGGLETGPAAQRPADVPAPDVPATGSRGKLAADQVGKLSPVPAFEGGGAHPYSVAVAVDGLAPLRGCGELALP
jgi:hypothetical protein